MKVEENVATKVVDKLKLIKYNKILAEGTLRAICTT
jgi:hypothetical protein